MIPNPLHPPQPKMRTQRRYQGPAMLEAADHGDLIKGHPSIPQLPHSVIQPHAPGERQGRHAIHGLKHAGKVTRGQSSEPGQVVDAVVDLRMTFQVEPGAL